MSRINLPEPIAAYFDADTRGPDVGNFRGSPLDMKLCFRLERGLISALEISA